MFGVVFPNHSFPIDTSTFTQIDPTHYLLDMTRLPLTQPYTTLRQLCIFLLNPYTLPPDKALAVYIQPPNPATPFIYCGAVTNARPSAVLTLPWPEESDSADQPLPAAAKIGVSVEDVAVLPALDVANEVKVERVAMRVGENLFNFMQSFCGIDGSRLVVPMDILDRWFKKFQERAKRDTEFLKSFTL